ncbi:hypothetical protein FHP29_17820 [Nocardioides albidus]|uniref:ATP-binding protein n=1 Tax=Nocardioides albidus TaxID=1517589 RepID=A0A5C4VQC0_9ACTN|nr:ATP-binding protein [Nocardioides albidus]TNM37646.1 hypothetical protein FHP29_17820 [Nocardioides albidus]
MTRITVHAGKSILESYVKRPGAGLCELIWNAFDEDATLVRVRVTTNALGAIDQIQVEDDGHGMNLQRAQLAFETVGDSWKRKPGALTEGKRPVHGKLGRGRYAAFGLGRSVQWVSTAPQVEGGAPSTVTVRGNADDLQHMEISEGACESTTSGTRVVVGMVTAAAQSAFDRTDDLRNQLLGEFALHLERYEDFNIEFLDEALTPVSVIETQREIELELPDGVDGTASLTLIEWNLSNVDRRLYLCTADGSIIDDIPPGIRSPGSEFTAYLRWDGFSHDAPMLLLDDLDSLPGQVITTAKAALRAALADSARKREADTVRGWKAEGVYPFEDGEPQNAVESATREIFNVVAMTTARTIEETKSRRVKALALRLMREALENDPESLLPILHEVVKLPGQRLDELKEILERTSLTHLIQVGKEIGGRVDFLNGLDALLFDRQTRRRMLERRQLHRILANETWLFGEQWSITGDDKPLNAVLKKFLQKLGQDVELASSKIVRDDGKEAIPDLVLGRSMPSNEDRMTHLVVELKRPNHRLEAADVDQLRSYASAIVNDERFNQPNVTWDFWLIGNDTRKDVDEMRRQIGRPFGCAHQGEKYSIWVHTWAEVLSSARHRIKFVEQSLQYESDRDTGLSLMRERYAPYLPDEVFEEEIDQGTEAG